MKTKLLVTFLTVAVVITACKTWKITPTISLEEITADPSYMSECREMNSQKLAAQVDFENIYPGTSRSKNVNELFGDPKDKYQESGQKEIWYYDGVSFELTGELVTGIHLYNSQKLQSLKNYIGDLGCPEVLIKIPPTKNGETFPGSLQFIYNKIGIRLQYFSSVPVKLNDKPESVFFFTPSNLNIYLDDSNLMNGFAKIIPWEEAVR